MSRCLYILCAKSGGASAEYVLIIALIGMGAIAGALMIGGGLERLFTAESRHINTTDMIDIP